MFLCFIFVVFVHAVYRCSLCCFLVFSVPSTFIIFFFYFCGLRLCSCFIYRSLFLFFYCFCFLFLHVVSDILVRFPAGLSLFFSFRLWLSASPYTSVLPIFVGSLLFTFVTLPISLCCYIYFQYFFFCELFAIRFCFRSILSFHGSSFHDFFLSFVHYSISVHGFTSVFSLMKFLLLLN